MAGAANTVASSTRAVGGALTSPNRATLDSKMSYSVWMSSWGGGKVSTRRRGLWQFLWQRRRKGGRMRVRRGSGSTRWRVLGSPADFSGQGAGGSKGWAWGRLSAAPTTSFGPPDTCQHALPAPSNLSGHQTHLRTIQRLLVRLSGSTTEYWCPSSPAAASPGPCCCCSAAVCCAMRMPSAACGETRGRGTSRGDDVTQRCLGWRRRRRRRKRLVGSAPVARWQRLWTDARASCIDVRASKAHLPLRRHHVGRQPRCPLHNGLQVRRSSCEAGTSVETRARHLPSSQQQERARPSADVGRRQAACYGLPEVPEALCKWRSAWQARRSHRAGPCERPPCCAHLWRPTLHGCQSDPHNAPTLLSRKGRLQPCIVLPSLCS